MGISYTNPYTNAEFSTKKCFFQIYFKKQLGSGSGTGFNELIRNPGPLKTVFWIHNDLIRI